MLYALIGMRHNRSFAAAAVLTMALGIGGDTAMFTVIRSVLLKPLAYPEPDRLVEVSGAATSIRFDEMKATAKSYAGLGAYLMARGDESITLASSAEPEVLKSARVSANFLSILEVKPLVGRGFRQEEDTASGPRAAMISSELWRRRFGANPAILGKTATLAATAYTIVGVLPPGFRFPFPDVDVWITRPWESVSIYSPLLNVFGRLKPGIGIRQANSELAVLNQQYRTAHPGMLDGKSSASEQVTPLRDSLVSGVRFLLWLLFGAVGFVLLIACGNVASLLLARSFSRSREFAIRAAVGASRGRLIQQLLVESVVLSVSGGALGLLFAKWSLMGIVHVTALDLPRAGEIHVDGTVLGFAVLLSIATGVVFGLIPSIGASRPNLVDVLRAGGEGANLTGGRRFGLGLSARGALVIGQVALSTVLLIGAVLLMQSLARLSRVNPGFNPSHLLTFRISLPPLRYKTNQKQAAFFDQLVQRLQSTRGVRSAAAAMTLPMTGFARTPVQLAAQAPLPLNERPLAIIEDVTPAYFRTFEIPLKRGREFSERDVASAPSTAIINESLARVLWPAYPAGLDPVGQRILIGAKADAVQIVGIVADIHQSLAWDPWPSVFRPFDQSPFLFAGLAVRTTGNPLQLIQAVNRLVLGLDRDQPASEFRTMDDLIESEGGQRRLILMLLECFGGAALLLALIGIYGVIAYSVAQRAPEMGIRKAVGARPVDILRLVVGQGLALTMAGVVVGLGAALELTQLMTSLLFHTRASDPATYLAVVLLFLVMALVASYLPARRAAKIDPVQALRA
jgi:predicted permease